MDKTDRDKSTRDLRIIRHIGLHRLSLRVTLEKLFFNNSETACDNVITRLRNSGRIQAVRGLPGRYSYYQLTTQEATAQGFPPERAKALGPQALHEHLAVLWFCCMEKTPRYRLEKQKVQQLLRMDADAPFCAEEGAKERGGIVHRLFIPGPKAQDSYTIEKIRQHVLELQQLSPLPNVRYSLADWVRERRYAITILTDQATRRSRFNEIIKKENLRAIIPVYVFNAPSPDTLKEAISDLPQPVRPSAEKRGSRKP